MSSFQAKRIRQWCLVWRTGPGHMTQESEQGMRDEANDGHRGGRTGQVERGGHKKTLTIYSTKIACEIGKKKETKIHPHHECPNLQHLQVEERKWEKKIQSKQTPVPNSPKKIRTDQGMGEEKIINSKGRVRRRTKESAVSDFTKTDE